MNIDRSGSTRIEREDRVLFLMSRSESDCSSRSSSPRSAALPKATGRWKSAHERPRCRGDDSHRETWRATWAGIDELPGARVLRFRSVRGEYDVTPGSSADLGRGRRRALLAAGFQRARLHDRARGRTDRCGRSDRERGDETLGILDSHASRRTAPWESNWSSSPMFWQLVRQRAGHGIGDRDRRAGVSLVIRDPAVVNSRTATSWRSSARRDAFNGPLDRRIPSTLLAVARGALAWADVVLWRPLRARGQAS